MYRPFLLALVVLCLAGLLFARPADPADEVPMRPPMQKLMAAIQTELQSHGDYVLGKGLYGWSTRLDKIENCRAELTVRVANNTGEALVNTESVDFSLGAIEPYSIELKKNYLELPCAANQNCIFSTSTCSKKSKDGIVIDCATASQKRVGAFRLEFDGDVESAARLEKNFRQAVELCRAPKSVSF